MCECVSESESECECVSESECECECVSVCECESECESEMGVGDGSVSARVSVRVRRECKC